MDGHRFDDLTRRLGTITTRRAAVRGAAAGLLGLLGLGVRANAQITQAHCGNRRCAYDPGVCNNGCVCCVYGNGNDRCRPPGTCGPGTVVCPPGQSNCGGGGCRDLSSDSNNCGACGRVCPAGACEAGACDLPNGASCSAGAQCRSGICAARICCDRACDGACESCALAGGVGACTNLPDTTPCGAGDLCSGLPTCRAGACVPGSAVVCTDQPPAGSCRQNACNPTNGRCEDAPKPNGSGCDSDSFCRENETCTNGVCGGGDAVSCTNPPICQTFPGQCFEPARPGLPGGCFYRPEQDGLPCGTGKRCSAGSCVDCIPSGQQIATPSCADIVHLCCDNVCTARPGDDFVTCG